MSAPDESLNYWCTNTPNVPRVWSASSLTTLSACPRRFQYSYVQGWTSKESNLDLTFGSAFHTCLEIYWHTRLLGYSHSDSLDEGVWAALHTGWNLPEPKRPKQKAKTWRGLVAAVVWYLDHWNSVDEPADIISVGDAPGLELHFSFALPLKNSDGEDYRVQGYLDSIRTFCNSYTAWDYKTTAGTISEYYLKRFEINLQNAVYTIAARVLTQQDFTQFMADVVSVDVRVQGLPEPMVVCYMERYPISMTEDELDEYLVDITHLIRSAERFADSNYWPKNTDACTFCQYSEICNKSPDIRPTFLKSEFKQERRTTTNARNE